MSKRRRNVRESRKGTIETKHSRRDFLKSASIAAGAAMAGGALWASNAVDTGNHQTALSKIDPLKKIDQRLMITPEQAWEWNVFKAQGGPTYAGSAGWKRYTDFLVAKMQELGAIDLESVEIPYDRYIVEDWPDRKTHMHDSGAAVEKLVSNGMPVPLVAS